PAHARDPLTLGARDAAVHEHPALSRRHAAVTSQRDRGPARHVRGLAMMGRVMLGRLWCHRGGNTAVEFALLLPVVAAFMLGILELGRMFYHRSTLEHAVEETGRYAMAHAEAGQSELTRVLQERAAVALRA